MRRVATHRRLLVLVVSAVIVGCGGSQEKEVTAAFDAYRSAIQARDLDGVRALVTTEKAGDLGAMDPDLLLDLLAGFSPASPRIGDVSVEGNRAVIRLTGELEGQTMSGEVELRQEGTAWRIHEERWTMELGALGGGDWAGRLRGGPEAKPRQAQVWSAHQGKVTSLAFTPDGDRVVSVSYDDMHIRMWDRGTGGLVAEAECDNRPTGMVMTGRGAVVVDAYGAVTLWPLGFDGFGEPVRFQGQAGGGAQIAASADGARLATTAYDGPVQVWSVAGQRPEKSFGKSEMMRGVAFSPRDNRLVTGGMDNRFWVWNLNKGNGSRKDYTVSYAGEQSDVWSVAVSPDGKLAATGHMDSSVSIWDLSKGKELHNFYVRDASTLDVEFSPDGTLLATGQQNGSVYLWDTGSALQLARLEGHGEGASAVAFSAVETEILASGSGEGRIAIWQ